MKALQAHGERAASIVPAKLAHYLDERIVLASWYPLEDYAELLRALMKAAGGGRVNPCEKMGRDARARTWRAPTAASARARTARPRSRSCPPCTTRGELRVVERETGRAVVEFLNFAQPTREICDTFTGYQAERMVILGFEDVQVKHTKCRVIGAVSCVWELSWKGRDSRLIPWSAREDVQS